MAWTTDVSREADQELIQHMIAGGCDMSKPREISHWLYAPDKTALLAIIGELVDNWHLNVCKSLGPTPDKPDRLPWLIMAFETAPLSIERLAECRELFASLAAKHGGEYDGWEASFQHHVTQ